MPTIQLPANGWKPRWYQRRAWNAWEEAQDEFAAGRRGRNRQLLAWHRRAGKDELNLNQHAVASFTRVGNYWHLLPEQAQARKVLWHAVNPLTGKRRIYDAFPREIMDGDPKETEMMIRFKSGSTFQLMGSDNYNSAVGAPPVGITFSEWALANPAAWAYLSPILTENGGWASFISTPRGNNHFKRMFDQFENDPHWFVERLGVDQTGMVTPEAIEEQRTEYRALYGQEIADMLIEQEFYCSFAGASVGSILARLVDKAERDNRIRPDVAYDELGSPVHVSADIGFYDTAAWWFWQPHSRGFRLLKYIGSSGLDAEDWAGELQTVFQTTGWKLGKIYLPHDANARTFQAKRTSMEVFIRAFGIEHVAPIPVSTHSDQINAARITMDQCEFNETECIEGLDALRGWQFTWNDETRSFSRDFKHDFASHGSQSFAYGCQVMKATPSDDMRRPAERHLEVGEGNRMTIDDAWKTRARPSRRI